jgi:hypothetical protein
MCWALFFPAYPIILNIGKPMATGTRRFGRGLSSNFFGHPSGTKYAIAILLYSH